MKTSYWSKPVKHEATIQIGRKATTALNMLEDKKVLTLLLSVL